MAAVTLRCKPKPLQVIVQSHTDITVAFDIAVGSERTAPWLPNLTAIITDLLLLQKSALVVSSEVMVYVYVTTKHKLGSV